MNTIRWLPHTAISLLLIGGVFLLAGCNDKNAANQGIASKQEKPAIQVTSYTAKQELIDVTTVLPARTNAFLVAEIRPQVSGTILKRDFTEGSLVQVGQSLYQIDPATYQATVNSAKASLASAKANAELAQLSYKRIQSLLNSKAVSQQEYDQAKATAAQNNAAVMIAQAALDTAQINLAYTKVYSPITGRIGKSSVTEGALVSVGQAVALATVQQLDPMYVDMTQSTTDFLRLKQQLANGTLQQQNTQAIVTLTLENGQSYPFKGMLEFSDVTVDETTGSILLRAMFPNPDNLLLPGMFVRATLNDGQRNNSILIPQQSVTRDVKGNASVKLINANNQVETRNVVAEKAIGANWLISEGLKDGDRVIITGLQKIRDGALVNDKNEPVAAAENTAATKSVSAQQ